MFDPWTLSNVHSVCTLVLDFVSSFEKYLDSYKPQCFGNVLLVPQHYNIDSQILYSCHEMNTYNSWIFLVSIFVWFNWVIYLYICLSFLFMNKSKVMLSSSHKIVYKPLLRNLETCYGTMTKNRSLDWVDVKITFCNIPRLGSILQDLQDKTRWKYAKQLWIFFYKN